MSERDRLCDFLCDELWAWVRSDDEEEEEEEEDTSLDKLLLQASESSRPHSRLVMVQAKAQL